ncbi:MAG: fatty acid desaturase [Phycisphaeraceae bacterium]
MKVHQRITAGCDAPALSDWSRDMEANPAKKFRSIPWYKTPLDRDLLKQLNQRSNLRGLAQALGHLSLLAITGGVSVYSAYHWSIVVTLALLFLHGTCFAFMINAVHELVHNTVFRSRWLNELFVRVFAFLGWINFEHFQASHVRHHAFTLHPPDDGEVVLPMRIVVRDFLRYGFVNWRGPYYTVRGTLRNARGRFDGEWSATLFPDRAKLRGPIRWARVLLIGHALILAVSICMHGWMIPVVVTLAPFYGGWLFFLLNSTQHIGLQDNVPDFRLCCRTILVNPVAQFLYWHMNFHTEHHMYPTVPCYYLPRLHRAMKHDMPYCPRGLIATWRHIADILHQQQLDPTYQYHAELPGQSDAGSPQVAGACS